MAETIKIKVLSVEHNRSFTTSSGFKIEYFKLKDEDENMYEFSTNKNPQTKFLIGQTYEVTVEIKQNKSGEYKVIDLSNDEKERRKGGTAYSANSKGGGKWVRSRKEVLSIISQSSYEAAAMVSSKLGSGKITSHTQVKEISKQFMHYIIQSSGLNSPECKNGDKDALSTANNNSIVYQKSLKIAVICLDVPGMESKLVAPMTFRSTAGIIAVTDLILNDINELANGF